MNVLRIQEELKEYRKLCNQFKHSPAQQEFDEIVKFILLYSGNGGMYESVEFEDPTINKYLFENFKEGLNEFEAGGDTASTAIKAGSDAVKGAATMAAFGAEQIGTWITYFFKKGKVKKFGEKEFQLSTKLLDEYSQIYKLKTKKAELEGKESPKADYPGYLG